MEEKLELSVEPVTTEEDVQIYKVKGDGIAVTFTNSSKTGRLYIDGKGSRKFRDQIIDAVIKQTNNIKIGRPSRVSLPIMINVSSNNEVIKTDDYIKSKMDELTRLNFENVTEEEIKNQLNFVLTKNFDQLNPIGEFIKEDVQID